MPKDTSWRLTSLGREKAKGISSNDARHPIIAYLYDTGGTPGKEKGTGTASTEELALHLNQSSGAVFSMLRTLQSKGLIKKVGSEE